MDTTVSYPALPLPTAAVLSYVAEFGVGAVSIFAPPIGFPVLLGATQDVAGALAAARKAWPKDIDAPVLARCWWARDPRACQQIVTLTVGNDLRRAIKDGARLAVSVAEAETAILAAARRLSIQLTQHDPLLARASAAVGQIDDRIRIAQGNGGLRFFNKEFQRRRRAAQAKGLTFMSYRCAYRKLQKALAHAAADQAAGGDLNAGILRRVFERED